MSSNDAVQEIEKAVRLDIVLSEPSAPKPAALENVEYRSPPSAEEIQKKLDDAQKRRISLISEKQASLAAHMSKIEDIHQRKQQQDAEFIRATKEAIDQKLETAEEKRIQQLNDLKAKVLFFSSLCGLLDTYECVSENSCVYSARIAHMFLPGSCSVAFFPYLFLLEKKIASIFFIRR